MLPLSCSVVDQEGAGREEVALTATGVQPAIRYYEAASRKTAEKLDRPTNLGRWGGVDHH